jgi:malate dehydrogenase
MLHVAIVGAGELGGAVAFALARCDVAASIRLIDASGTAASGKALDIMQAGAIEGFTTIVTGTNDLYALGGASLVVMASPVAESDPSSAPVADWQDDEGLAQLKRVGQIAGECLIVCAGAGQRNLVERGIRELHLSRTAVMGSAPEALASALRAFVALEADASPKDIALTVLGVPPAHIVVPWEQATIGGVSLTRVLQEPALRRLAARVAPLWPPAPHALAAAAVKAIKAISGTSREVVSCFVAPDDSAGQRARAIALPARLGPAGIVSAEVPPLSVHDRIALDNAMLL